MVQKCVEVRAREFGRGRMEESQNVRGSELWWREDCVDNVEHNYDRIKTEQICVCTL